MSRSVPCGLWENSRERNAWEGHDKQMKRDFHGSPRQRRCKCAETKCIVTDIGCCWQDQSSWSIESPIVNYSCLQISQISLNFSTAILDPHSGILPLIAVRITIAKVLNQKQLGVSSTWTKEKKQHTNSLGTILPYTSIFHHCLPLPFKP